MADRWLYYRKRSGEELREDRRIRHPVFIVMLGEQPFRSVNWSLGGILLESRDRSHGFEEGQAVTGTIREQGMLEAEPVEFQVKVVRVEGASCRFALEFERDTGLIDFFEGRLRSMMRPPAER